jgi:glutamate-1-semialdehyde 2,1-aminomutase
VAFGTSARGVHNYDDAQGQEVFRYAPFFHFMLDSGVYLPPSVFEAWFLSAAHDDAAMNRIFDALPAAREGGGCRARRSLQLFSELTSDGTRRGGCHHSLITR